MYRVFFLGFFSLLSVLAAHPAYAGVSASPNPSTSGNFTLSWTNAQAITFVQEVPVSGNLVHVATVSGSSYQITGKAAGTYTYRISTQAHPSSCLYYCFPTLLGDISVTVTNPPSLPTPGGLSVPSSSSTGTYTVSWSSVSGQVNSYQLQERKNSGSWSTVQNTSSRSRNFSKGPGGYYDYRVRACNASVCSSYSSTKRITIPAASLSASVTSGLTYSNLPITITWSSSMTTSCVWDGTALPGTSGSFTKTVSGWQYEPASGLDAKSTSVVCQLIGGGTISKSLHLSGLGSRPLPEVEVSWGSSSVSIGSSIQINWTAVNADDCTLDGNTLGAQGSRSYTFSSAGTVSKTVVCSNVSGDGSATASINVVYPTPSRPAYISVPAGSDKGQYTVSWPSSSGDVTAYYLQERAVGGSWSTVQNNLNRSRAFSKAAGTAYDYRVRACNHSSCSSYTSYGRIAMPDAEVNVSVSGAGTSIFPVNYTNDRITVTWSSVMTNSCWFEEGNTLATSGTLDTVLTTGWVWDDFNNFYYYPLEMTCSVIGGGQARRQLILAAMEIPPKPTVNVNWNSTSGVVGQSSILTWSASDADNCTLDGAGIAVSGSRSYTPTSDGAFSKTVTCTNDQGSTSVSASINVVYPAPTLTVAVDSSYGATDWGFTHIPFSLDWSSAHTSSCQYYDSNGGNLSVNNRPATGSVPLNGSQLNWSASNPSPYKYASQVTVSCAGLNGTTVNRVINLAAEFLSTPSAPVVNAHWEESLVARNEPALFTWESEYASSCTLNGENVVVNGSRSRSFETSGLKTWEIVCTNAGTENAVSSDTLEVATGLYLPDLNFPVAQNPSNDTLDGNNYFGALRGDHSVGDNGAFTYNIPIEVAPGINGMEPEMAFSYSSDATQGLLGWGWSISGLSSIGRCPATIARDGYISGIGANDNYKFCLDGERLVSIGGGEYRTESESFKKIVNEGAHWVVHHSNGKKSFYGYNAGSNSTMSDANNLPIKWFIDRQQDTANNYLTYHYEKDSDSAAIRIKEIQYTKNDAAVSINNSLEFFYGSRADTAEKYIAGTRVDTDVRLARVEAKANSNIVYSYHIEYETYDGITFADPTQTSRISEITKCYGTTATCADSITFDWTDTDVNSFRLDASDSAYILPEDIAEHRYGASLMDADFSSSAGGRRSLNSFGARGDFDGDGRLEVAWMDCLEPATTENWDTQTCNRVVAMDASDVGVVFEHTLARQLLESTATSSSGTKSYGQSRGTLVGQTIDFNGDGLDDYYMHNSYGMIELNVYLSDGTSLAHSSAYSKTLEELGNFHGTLGGVTTIWRYNFIIMDVDGDGLPDLLRLPHWHDGTDWVTISQAGVTDISVALNTGSGFSDFVQWGESTDYLSLSPDYSADGITLSDVNGDGLPDLVGVAKDVGINTGSSFDYSPSWGENIGVNDIVNYDVLVAAETMPFGKFSPGQESQSGTQPVEGYESWAYMINTEKFTPMKLANKFADVNGDGLSDYVALRGGGVFVALSDGSKFLPAVLWTDEITLNDITPFCNMMECNTSRRSWNVADVNRDGLADITFAEAWYFSEKAHASNISVLFSKGHVRNGSGFYAPHLVASVGLNGNPSLGVEACINELPRLGKPMVTELGDFVVHCQPSFEDAEMATNVGIPFDRSRDEAMDIGIRRHKIERVNESTSRAINVEYQQLIDNSVYVHETGADAGVAARAQVAFDFPVHAADGLGGMKTANSLYPSIFRGREVVSGVEVYINNEPSETTDYKYYTQKFARDGWGSLGFEKIEKTTTLAGYTQKRRSVTEYLQEVADNNRYGLVKPRRVVDCVVSDDTIEGCDTDSGAQLLSETIKNWKVRVYNNTTPRYFPYTIEEQTRNYDLDTGTLLSTVIKRLYNDGVTDSCPALSAITKANRATNIDEHFDAYGTALDVVENRCDTFGVTGTHTDNDNVLNDTGNWCLNLTRDPKVRKWVYDSTSGSLDSMTRHTNFSYNSSGSGKCQVNVETREPNGGNAIWLRSTYGYNDYGTRDSITETVRDFTGDGISFTSRNSSFTETYSAAGERTVVSFNALNHKTTQVFNAAFGVLDRSQDPNELVSVFTYDVAGRPETSTTRGVTTTYDYRSCNNCFAYNSKASWYMQTKTEGQSARRTYYDGLGREVGTRWRGLLGTHYYQGQRYTPQGQVAASTEPFSNSADAAALETEQTYDVLGRVVRTDFPTGAFQTLSHTVLDGAAAVVSTDSLGNSKTQRFDALGREKQVVDAMDTSVYYWHDALGNVTDIRVVDALGVQPIDHSIVFDMLGRKTQLNDPDVGHIDYVYNAFGKLTSQVNAEGQRLCYFYDALDRQIQRRDNADSNCNGGLLQSWSFDRPGELGLLAEVNGRDTSNRVHNEVYTYTLENFLPESVTQEIDGESFSITHYYDSFNRPVAKSYPTGFTVEQRYNSYGVAYQAVNVQNGEVLWAANDDDARGNVTEVAFGNGASVSSRFTLETGLLQTRAANLGSQILQDHTYTFDAEGNLRSRRDDRVSITQNFCYDPLYRLTDQTINSSCADDLNGSYAGTAYAYDAHGNIMRKDGITDYSYGGSAQNAGPHAVSYANGGDYIYDDAGRMVGSPLGRTIHYSAFGKPTYMGIAGVYETRVIYGALQKRVQREDFENNTTTLTTYVGKDYERIENPDGSTEHRHYLNDWGVHVYLDGVSATEQYTVYITRDHIGSIASKSDDRTGSDQTIKHHANEPWGRRQDKSWDGVVYDTLRGSAEEDMTFGTNRGFTDHEHLDGIGLIHMNGRVYDPVVGRFVSPDPWIQDPENSQSFNRYSYVWNNPLRYTDPTGEITEDQCGRCTIINFGDGSGAQNMNTAMVDSMNATPVDPANSNVDVGMDAADTVSAAPLADTAFEEVVYVNASQDVAVQQTQQAADIQETAQNLGAGVQSVSVGNEGDVGRVEEVEVCRTRSGAQCGNGASTSQGLIIWSRHDPRLSQFVYRDPIRHYLAAKSAASDELAKNAAWGMAPDPTLSKGGLLKGAKKLVGKGFPTKKGFMGKPQPYDPKTGQYLPFEANPGIVMSPLGRFSAGFSQGVIEAKGAGVQGATPVGKAGSAGHFLGVVLGNIF